MTEQKKKIANYIYKNGINYSARKFTSPEDNLSIKKPYRIALANLVFDGIKKLSYVRARFVGSDMFYEISIKQEDEATWFDRLKIISVKESDFDDFDSFEDDAPIENKKTKQDNGWNQ